MSYLAPSSTHAQLTDFARVMGIEAIARAYAVSRWLTRATPGKPRRTPGCLGLAWEPCACRTGDGLRLAGWLITPPRPRATVALFHGLRGGREEMLPYVALLAGAGYRCVAFDHRAHGESDGRRTSFGYHEARDVAAVIDWVQERWPRHPRALLGRCLGAAAVCFAGARRCRPDAAVLESLVPDPGTVILRASTRNPDPSRFRESVRWITGVRLGVPLADVSPARHLGSLAPAPVLLAAGTHDELTSPTTIRQLLGACRGPCDLHLAVGAGRGDLRACESPAYRECLLEFLERRLRRAARAAA